MRKLLNLSCMIMHKGKPEVAVVIADFGKKVMLITNDAGDVIIVKRNTLAFKV